jgi:hypothetical protein
MNAARIFTAPTLLTCLLAVNTLSPSLLAQTPAPRPASRSGHTFAPASPGQKVVYRPAGDNVIEVAAKPGVPTLADKAIAARNAQLAQAKSGTIRQASTSHMMQEPAEEVPAPVGRAPGERSVVVPSTGGQMMEEIPPGQTIKQGPWIDSQSGQVVGDHYDQPFFTPQSGVVMNDGMPAEGCADCGCYGGVRDGLRVLRPCADGCLIPCPRISVDNTQVFAGAQGFTGVANRGETGSFGFHEGVNLGGPFPFLPMLDLSMQAGVMATQSNHNGASFTPLSRDQLFTTLGIFHRVDWGFQGGVVVDYMHDEWYYSLDIYQIRGEISWVNPECHEVGFWFTTADNLQVTNSQIQVGTRDVRFEQNWEVTDIYAFFYRKRFCETNGVLRGYGGFTENGDAIVGADATAPLSDSLAVSGAFTYLIPNSDEPNGLAAHERESWNVQISLVWFPGKGARQWTYHRPLMGVANNGTMFLQNP